MSGNHRIQRPVSEEDVRKYEQAWTEMMVTIWRENILRLGIVRTRKLHNDITFSVTDNGGQITIAHQFMIYGIYVAHGVGREFGKGYQDKLGRKYKFERDSESGYIPYLDKKERKARGMQKQRKVGPAWGGNKTSGEHRKKRDWLYPRYLSSIDILTQVEMELYGEAYMGTLSNVVEAIFGNVEVKGDRGTVVTGTMSRY